jgi:uncharacterized RDD family membrane protein YckC
MQVQAGYRQPSYPPSYADQPIFGAPAAGSYAGIGSRFGAVFIDGLIGGGISILGNIFSGVLSSSGDSGAEAVGAVIALFFAFVSLAFFLFNVYLLGRDGATIGKRVLKIRVLDQTGQPLGFGRALLRELCKFISAIPCYLGFLWAFWDQEKQTWHDKILSTHVYDA